jgi:hypothetical protein
MATPFVAGAAALMLSVNPQLSPDQIEQILTQTADPMPGYAFHQVGAGYIDVREAVEVAGATPGQRVAFLAGNTTWSAQGGWTAIADGDSRLRYTGAWRVRSSAGASDGAYREARPGASLRATFTGDAVKLAFPTNAHGGVGDVYVDGAKRSTVSFYSAAAGFSSVALDDLGPGSHSLELRAMKGATYVDGLSVAGQLYPDETTFVDETQTYTGTMGPSAADLEIDRYMITVGADAATLKGRLAWTGALDLDLYLVDPGGARVAAGATTSNPETFEFAIREPGTYTIEVTGFATVAAAYTVTATVTRAITP